MFLILSHYRHGKITCEGKDCIPAYTLVKLSVRVDG